MTLSLRSREWKPAYSDEEDDIVKDFLIPALENSIRYDRAAGFYSSTVLAVAARGITRLIRNGGRMRLITSVRLSEEDSNAINRGVSAEKTIEEAMQRDFSEPEDLTERSRLQALAWLVANGLLEIKVAIPVDRKGGVQPCGDGKNELFHSKVGVFVDSSGDRVSFSGSINESGMGWTAHNEQFHVHLSWRDPDGHVSSDVHYFEKHWENRTNRARVYSFPEAMKRKLIECAPAEAPEVEPEEEMEIPKPRPGASREDVVLLGFARDAPFLPNGEALTEAFATFRPRPHQLAVADAVTRAFPRRFVLADEVGLGKTIETGMILKRLIVTGRVRRCLVLAPRAIVKQWQEELAEKFSLNFLLYDGQELLDVHEDRVPHGGNPYGEVDLIMVSMNLVRRKERQDELFAAPSWDLVVLDEAHHARRRNITWGDHEPNLLLRLMRLLEDHTTGLLLVTATPMQLYLLELYDLLGLLGTRGRWATDEEAFVRFFDSLTDMKRGAADYPLMFAMAREYYATGGASDPDFEQEAKRRLGLASWARVKSVLAATRLGRAISGLDPEELVFLQEYLSRSTPLHSLMFRNTRGLLKRYREKGLAVEPFPEREVEDVFVDLKEPDERALYDKIEEYVAHFYRKAEARNNLILKLVMQGFRRRMTSSLGAIRKSLLNRIATIEASGLITTGLTEEDLEDPDVDVDVVGQEAELHEEADLLLEEIEFLRQFVVELEGFRQDSKLDRFLTDLQQLLNVHEHVLVFTQFTDTMDYLRDFLVPVYGSKVACYAGRGGEVFDPAARSWKPLSKELLKQEFKKPGSRIKILLGTEALSEGLNLQAASAVVNYDMPWNPMKVEQRIGRIDRIGQKAERITVRNYFYRDTIEDQIYHVLGERHNLFREVVGEAPQILAMIHEAIKEGVAVPHDQRLAWINAKRKELRERFELLRQDRLILENMALPTRPGEEPLEPPLTPEDLEGLLTSSPLTRQLFEKQGPGVYKLTLPRVSLVTFDPRTADEKVESVAYLSYGSELLKDLLASAPKSEEIGVTRARIVRVECRGPRQAVAYFCKLTPSGLTEILTLHQLADLVKSGVSLLPFDREDRSVVESKLRKRVEEELDRERRALDGHELSKLKNFQNECRQILDELVAIELARNRTLAFAEQEDAVSSFIPPDISGSKVLEKLLRTRADRIPALCKAAKVDVPSYALDSEIAKKYEGKRPESLDGSRGPLMKKADAVLEALHALAERLAQPPGVPSLDFRTEGLL